MLKNIAFAIVAVIGGFVAYIALQPSDYLVARSTIIKAPPEVVFQHINDFRKWQDWSPWAKRDPNSKNEYAGPEEGEGAVYKWDGNDDVGKGQMTILNSDPAREVKIKLDFERPFEDTSDVGFILQPVDEGTKVTWTLAGSQGFVEKAMMTLMGVDLEAMVGKDYETGLASLKQVAENSAGW